MRIMRRRDIDDIHCRILTGFLKACIDLLHTVFFCKSHCFLLRTVHDTIQLLPSFFHCLRKFICNDAAAGTHPVCHLFSPFLSAFFIFIHLRICFMDDLADIHAAALRPAYGTGDWDVSLPIFFHEIGFYSLYHGLYLGFYRILDNHNKLIPAHTINLASVRRQFIQYGG